MPETNGPHMEREGRPSVRSNLPDQATAASIQELIRDQRRMSLRARTVAISLASALRDEDEISGMNDRADRIALRRSWCQHVLDVVEELRTSAALNNRAFALIARDVAIGKSGTARFAAARIEFERHADRAEGAARRAMGDGI